MADQRSMQKEINNFSSNRPTTLPILSQTFQNNSQFTPGDYSKLLLTTPELDFQARGFTTPELINALAGATSMDEQNAPGIRLIEELMNNQNSSIRTTLTPSVNSYFPSNLTENVPSYSSQIPAGNIIRDRSVSSSIQDQDSSSSAIDSSPGRHGDESQVPSVGYEAGEGDDVIRREKKRERNRQAAQKCRTRKLNRIAELQKRVDELQGKNRDLTGLAQSLKSDVFRLEKQLEDHRIQGCSLVSNGYLS